MSEIFKQEFLSKSDLSLGDRETTSMFYHDIFDYPLKSLELIKWGVGKKAPRLDKDRVPEIVFRGGYFFFKGREGLILKRTLREKTSRGKLIVAEKAARVIGLVPSVKMVGVTGALCMANCQENADIDLMVISKKGTLWVTRALVYLILKLAKIPIRVAKDKIQKDKLCLNMWLDESDLIWRRRNIFTSHEIAQIIPLINKGETYEKFIYKNRWISEYWPNSIKIRNLKSQTPKENSLFSASHFVFKLFEPLAYFLQFWYMKNKITREVVKPTRALFHPVNWEGYIARKLRVFQVTT